jgi:D-sedoheptulose 7-phosphate isomerase
MDRTDTAPRVISGSSPSSARNRLAAPPGGSPIGVLPGAGGPGARGGPSRAGTQALTRFRDSGLGLVCAWGAELERRLSAGARLLVAGNGGSAAQAQHLTAELVGRYRAERPAYSALALHADTSTVTAVGNDYGFEELYARQVAAHGRPGDVLLLMSTSGRSPNLLAAAEAARAGRLRVWALTGPRPNPLALRAEETVAVEAESTATVQEMHLVALHLLCEAFDESREEAA